MQIKTIPIGPLQTNAYILLSGDGRAAIVDPAFEADTLIKAAEKQGAALDTVILTHGHFDHMAALPEIVSKTKAKVYIHEADAEMLSDPKKCLAHYFDQYDFSPSKANVLLKDNDSFMLYGNKVRVVHTPGHTKGSVCYLIGDMMLSGDTLFKGTVGRVDHYGGDFKVLMESVKKLSALSGDYTVLPGHGEPTTLDHERRTNPYMGNRDYDAVF